MTPQGQETILHTFCDGTVPVDGNKSYTGLLEANDGNFYGVTFQGGTANLGILYKLTPQGDYSILHHFGDGTITNDATLPESNLIQASDGNLYGTSYTGGPGGGGTIYKVNPQGAVSLVHGTTYGFGGGETVYDMDSNQSALLQASDGNLYATSYGGGPGSTSTDGNAGVGTFFKIVPATAAPTITSANAAIFDLGQSSSFSLAAQGFPVPTFTSSGLPSWAQLNSQTGVLSGTPTTATGSPFHVTVTAGNGVGSDVSEVLTLTVRMSFTQWETAYGLSANASSTDGVPNLLKFLCDISPNIPVRGIDRTELPTVGSDTTTTPGREYLTLTYRQSAAENGLTIGLQTSSDLRTWTTVTPDISQPIGLDGNDTIIEQGVDVTDTPKLFIRLKITSQ
jgi:uncharacterized repeat protein (TIGR03803 family)